MNTFFEKKKINVFSCLLVDYGFFDFVLMQMSSIIVFGMG